MLRNKTKGKATPQYGTQNHLCSPTQHVWIKKFGKHYTKIASASKQTTSLYLMSFGIIYTVYHAN